jgi:uncharacterized secreted repeat protein (TIGR03808 family)
MNFARRSVLSGMTVFAAGAAAPLAVAAKANQITNLQDSLEKAIQGDGVLRLPAGRITTSGLRIDGPVRLEGIPGRTTLAATDAGPVLAIADAKAVTISGIAFEGNNVPSTDDDRGAALVMARNAGELVIEGCRFVSSAASGLRLEECSGRIVGNGFSDLAQTALFALDSKGLEISGNHVHDIGNNGILVWASAPGEDGTIVSNNRVERIGAKDGGSGQNGNGINVYRAGNVMISGNRVSDCAFSGVRNNSGSNCQILGNSISRTAEVAIYCEFAFEGAVVSGNLVEDVAFGISITNFDKGGRLAVCANNIVRKVKGGGSLADTTAVGIYAEADAQVSGNVVDSAKDIGIGLGWGPYCRNLSANGNIIRNCGRSIVFSLAGGAEPVMITGNRIAESTIAAIQGMDHKTPVTGDLGAAGARPPVQGVISGNFVS